MGEFSAKRSSVSMFLLKALKSWPFEVCFNQQAFIQQPLHNRNFHATNLDFHSKSGISEILIDTIFQLTQ